MLIKIRRTKILKYWLAPHDVLTTHLHLINAGNGVVWSLRSSVDTATATAQLSTQPVAVNCTKLQFCYVLCSTMQCSTVQCGTNILIFEFIWIYLDKYIHLSKYSLIYSKTNMFGYSFVIYLNWWIYSDIHSSNIYDREYIWIFIVSQKWFKMVIIVSKWFNMGPKYHKIWKFQK